MIRRSQSVLSLCLVANFCLLALGQAPLPNQSEIQESHTIILNPRIEKPLAFLYAASAKADVRVGRKEVDQSIRVQLRVIQGNQRQVETVSLGLSGEGNVLDVKGEGIASWAVRMLEGQRYLDLQLKPRKLDEEKGDNTSSLTAWIHVRSEHEELPAMLNLAHLTPGLALGFDSNISIAYESAVTGAIVKAEGFVPLQTDNRMVRMQSTTGGKLELRLDRSTAVPPDIEMIDSNLVGDVNSTGKSMTSKLSATAIVRSAGSRLRILSGNVAFRELPDSSDYRIELLNSPGGPVYELVFPKVGSFPVFLTFVSAIKSEGGNISVLDYQVAASAVVPLALSGFESEIEFVPTETSIVPTLIEKEWRGFLPATGRVHLRWRNSQNKTESKVFFTTSSIVDVSVGSGLLRQDHRITYQLLQGQIKSLTIDMLGPGEIVSVEGQRIVSWKVNGEGTTRQLVVVLNEPLTDNSQFVVRSQTTLGVFPVQVEGLSLQPQGATRNSGHLRLSNSGSVSIDPIGLRGLTQLAPEQFPGEAIQARQLFVYRYPAADYAFSITANRVEPEVNVTHWIIYELSETDRAISTEIELDIREAPIREWNMNLPAEYTVVSVTGSSVVDYQVASEVTDHQRTLKVLFGQDVVGRQLVRIRLEKSEAAVSGQWPLSPILFPEAKSVRGDIGVVVAPGFRTSVSTSELLVEKPLAYFPQSFRNLQQAFRIREPGWSATMQVEQLERSIQSDMFHLYSLSQGTVYGSALINYLVAGAPVSELQLTVPRTLANVTVDGQNIRSWRREGDTLTVSLQQPVLGTYTLLVTFEEKPNVADGSFSVGQVTPLGIAGDRGFIEVVSPVQVEITPLLVSSQLLALDSLELPAEFRLLSTAPALGTWQYTQRPFDLRMKADWFDPGTTADQIVEFAEANSRVSQDGEIVTDLLYFVKSRGQRTLKLQLPGEPTRLWAASVNGRYVNARTTGNATLIPLPGGSDLNEPIEVSLRVSKRASSDGKVSLDLPTVFAPVLRTQWSLRADENYSLIPTGGSIEPTVRSDWPTGFDWLTDRGFLSLTGLVLLVTIYAFLKPVSIRLLAVTLAIIIAIFGFLDAWNHCHPIQPLDLMIPVLASGESIGLEVANLPTWQAYLSWPGILVGGVGMAIFIIVWPRHPKSSTLLVRWIAISMVAMGLLFQINGGAIFFGVSAIMMFLFLLLPDMNRLKQSTTPRAVLGTTLPQGEQSSVVVPTWIAILIGSICWPPANLMADEKGDQPLIETQTAITLLWDGFQAADSIKQEWHVSSREKRLSASVDMEFSGRPGDQFLLLRAPAVLTQFDGSELRLSKRDVPGSGMVYVATIPDSPIDEAFKDESEDEAQPPSVDAKREVERKKYRAKIQFQLESIQSGSGIPVLTGNAAVHSIDLTFDDGTWDVSCDSAASIDLGKPTETNGSSVRLVLAAGPAVVVWRPRTRDVSTEETQFFVEGTQLYTPGPGVVDGKHRMKVRTSRGRVKQLTMSIPNGLTVSSVDGPMTSWQFDADLSRLQMQIDPAIQAEFTVTVETQRSLESLPTTVQLAPVRVENSNGEVGLMALAFGTEAQPGATQSETLSLVNLGDFDASFIDQSPTTLHRVYRYGTDPGSLSVHVSPVAPEVRVTSKQVVSFGDERVLLAVNFVAEITRTGLFQLSFPLPLGLDIESLTGDSLHHWSEVTEDGQRRIVLHLKGKTMGSQKFSLALAGATPTDANEWVVPRFALSESTRQSGELVIQSGTGIRLRPTLRQNVTEADPRAMGAQGQGALAFRLLQYDWSLQLGIEKLAPWVTGQVLHDITLREGQTRTTLFGEFLVQNAAVRGLLVKLPNLSEEDLKTVRVEGESVNDFVRTTEEERVWELRFKRRVIGPVKFQIEYERRGDRAGNRESVYPFEFPEVRQLGAYYAVRTGGRVEVEPAALSQGWQATDWSTVPDALRAAGNRNSPTLSLRAMAPSTPLSLRVVRHSLAEALKLRVASGKLTTVLSPTGDQLTAVDINMEVIQRSSLRVQLPVGSELFSIFVNGESVHSVRQKDSTNTWQFYILPGIDDRTAQVRFVYSLRGDQLEKLNLVSPQLNVPLEDIQWSVIAPAGVKLTDSDGSLKLVGEEFYSSSDRNTYLSSMKGKRQDQAQQASKLLAQANELLQTGERSKAHWAFNNVANRYALDAASNEDVRIQLENLQTQQAIVGLNTRRQRLFLDHNRAGAELFDNEQLRQAASSNPILQQEQLNYRPQDLSQLLAGNSKEDNEVLQTLAGRLVQHQRTTEPAPQGIVIDLPEEGTVYRFHRSVQVAENAPMGLQLSFQSQYQLPVWTMAGVALLVMLLSMGLVWGTSRRKNWLQSEKGS